jgi:hypothetical protein
MVAMPKKAEGVAKKIDSAASDIKQKASETSIPTPGKK